VLGRVGQINENVIEVDHHTNIKEVCKDLIHKMLESGRCITEAKRHDLVFEGAIACVEHHFPFVSSGNSNEVVCSSKIKLCKSFGGVEAVKEVGN